MNKDLKKVALEIRSILDKKREELGLTFIEENHIYFMKDKDGKNLVNHIGEYFVGKRVLPDEPYYEKFSRYIPEQRYNSKTGENWVK